MNVKVTWSNGDSQVLELAEVPARLAAQDSINADLSTPIRLVALEEQWSLNPMGFPAH